MSNNSKLPKYHLTAKKRIIGHGSKHINSFLDRINEQEIVEILEDRFGTPNGFRPKNPTSLNHHKNSFLAIFKNQREEEIIKNEDTWACFNFLLLSYGSSLFKIKPQALVKKINNNPKAFFNDFLKSNIDQSSVRQFYEYSFIKSDDKIIEVINKYPKAKEINENIKKLDVEKKLEHLINSVEATNQKTLELIETSKQYRRGYTDQLENITKDIQLIKNFLDLENNKNNKSNFKLSDIISDFNKGKNNNSINESQVNSLIQKWYNNTKEETENSIEEITQKNIDANSKLTQALDEINKIKQNLANFKQEIKENKQEKIPKIFDINPNEKNDVDYFKFEANYKVTDEKTFNEVLTSNFRAIGLSKNIAIDMSSKILIYIKYGFCINFIGSSSQLFAEAVQSAFSNKSIHIESSFTSSKPISNVSIIRNNNNLDQDEPISIIFDNINLTLSYIKFPWLKNTIIKNHNKKNTISEIFISTSNDLLDHDSTDFIHLLELGPIINTDLYNNHPIYRDLKISETNSNLSYGINSQHPDAEYDDLENLKDLINTDLKINNQLLISNIITSFKLLYDHFLETNDNYEALTDILLDWIVPFSSNLNDLKSILDNKFEDVNYMENSKYLQKVFNNV